MINVYGGGIVKNTTVNGSSETVLNVNSGATVSTVTIANGGRMDIYGGSVNGVTVSSGGQITAATDGGCLDNIVIGRDGYMTANGPKLTGVIYEKAAEVTEFRNFTETVPGSTAAISMIAVPGGEFYIGSPEDEPFRKADEGPRKMVKVSPFFMGEVEVTWNQFWAFYSETMSEGRTPPSVIYANNTREDIDAVSGPTPPFGIPDQGWGMGDRPAITMTHYAAETFCQWLSLKTGRHYRLPTEAEWEYAARGGTDTPYFFEGNPKKFSEKGFLKGIFKPDTTGIDGYVVYALNSSNRSQEPSEVKANPFGLKNMLGNVLEYCSDYYAEDAYANLDEGELQRATEQN